jgi:hypothetical protein
MMWQDAAGEYCPSCGMSSDHDGADEFGGGCDCAFDAHAAAKPKPAPATSKYSGGGMTSLIARKMENYVASPERLIADRIGGAVETVRRWQAGDPTMRKSTRAKIEGAARELGLLPVRP